MKRALALGLLLAAGGCLPLPEGPPGLPVEREVPVDQSQQPPDLAGVWELTPLDEGYKQLWTVRQSGQAIAGEITIAPETLPAGLEIPPRPIQGRFERYGENWVVQMETPGGRVIYEGKDQWSFCPKPGGASECLTARRRAGASPG